MRYFVDAQFNGFGGELVSLAAVPEAGDAPPFYEAIGCSRPVMSVRVNVIPVLHVKPRSWGEVAHLFSRYLESDPDPVIVSDWPEDIAHAAMLLTDHRGGRLNPARIRFELLPGGHQPEYKSELPYNAYHDAVALKRSVLARESQVVPFPTPVVRAG